jgi:hypothetical protein
MKRWTITRKNRWCGEQKNKEMSVNSHSLLFISVSSSQAGGRFQPLLRTTDITWACSKE